MLLCMNTTATLGIFLMMMWPNRGRSRSHSASSRGRPRCRSASSRERQDGRPSALRRRIPSPHTPPEYDPFPPDSEPCPPQPPAFPPSGSAPSRAMRKRRTQESRDSSRDPSPFTPGDDDADGLPAPQEPVVTDGNYLNDNDLHVGQIQGCRPLAWLTLGPVIQKMEAEKQASENFLPDLLRWCFVKSNKSKATKVHQVYCCSAKSLPHDSIQYYHKCCSCWDLSKRPSATARCFSHRNTIHCERNCGIYMRDAAMEGGNSATTIVELCRVCCPIWEPVWG